MLAEKKLLSFIKCGEEKQPVSAGKTCYSDISKFSHACYDHFPNF